MTLRPEQWLAEFARRDDAWRAERGEYHRVVGEKIRADLHPPAKVAPAPIVLEPGHEIDSSASDAGVPSAVRRVESVALSSGWSTRVVASLAAIPRTGLLAVVTVRCARHDERLWAAWWNGSFDTGQYLRAGGQVERLGAERMSLAPLAVTQVEAMTVGQIKTLAAERGIKIPSKYAKPAVIEYVKMQGLVASMPPPRVRGVLDAIEGLHLARHLVTAL